MKWLLLLTPIILFQSPSFAKKDTKKLIIASVEIPELSEKQALVIWNKATSYIKKMKKNCTSKGSLKEKVFFTANQMESLMTYSKNQYETYRYSLPSIKRTRYGKNKGALSILLLDIQKILNSSSIGYKKIKSREGDKACSFLKNSFIRSYKSHYNTKDNESLLNRMSPWAKDLHESLTCLCS